MRRSVTLAVRRSNQLHSVRVSLVLPVASKLPLLTALPLFWPAVPVPSLKFRVQPLDLGIGGEGVVSTAQTALVLLLAPAMAGVNAHCVSLQSNGSAKFSAR